MTNEEKEALRNFKSEYETCDHYSSDLIIELDDAETILNLIEKQSKEIEELKEGFKIQEHNYQVAMKEIEQRQVDKIKAKIEEMDNIISKNEQIRFNGRYEHLHTLTEARIVKGEMQSLLEKE